MTQKFAIPASNGILDEHFGHCSHFIMIEVKNNLIIGESSIEAPPHRPGMLPVYLVEKGVTDVIAGGMGQNAIKIFNQNHVNVFVGAPKLRAKDLVEGFLNKTLSFSANYCDH